MESADRQSSVRMASAVPRRWPNGSVSDARERTWWRNRIRRESPGKGVACRDETLILRVRARCAIDRMVCCTIELGGLENTCYGAVRFETGQRREDADLYQQRLRGARRFQSQSVPRYA